MAMSFGLAACGDDPSIPAPAACTLPRDAPHVVNIDADQNFTLALLSDGTITCWGEEIAGSCAYGDGRAGLVPRPTPSKNVACIVDVQVEDGFVTGIGQDGDLRLWGSSVRAVLPDATGLITTRALAKFEPRRWGSGSLYVIVETAESEYYWFGRIPLLYGLDIPVVDQVTAEATDWTKLPLQGASADISTSGQHICVLMESGELWCWGNNRSGQLGLPGTIYAEAPTLIPAPEQPIAIEVAREITCILGGSGSVYCTGTNAGGLLARPYSEYKMSETFLRIDGLPPASELWLGITRACARTLEGLWCWGVNDVVPEPAGEPVVPIDVAIGIQSICVLDATGTVYCASLTGSTYLGRCFDGTIDWQPVDLNLQCTY